MELNQELLNSSPVNNDLDDEEKYIGPSARCVLFNLETEVYGIQVKKIREVLRVSHIRDVAGSAHHILGVINVRGVIVTVVDMRTMFNMPKVEPDDLSRIIIVEIDENKMVGLLVDCVMEVKDIPENKIEALASTKDNPSRNIQGIAHFDGNVIILVDIDNMFS